MMTVEVYIIKSMNNTLEAAFRDSEMQTQIIKHIPEKTANNYLC